MTVHNRPLKRGIRPSSLVLDGEGLAIELVRGQQKTLSIDDLGFDEEDQYGEGEVEGSFDNRKLDDGEDIFPQDESVKGVEALVLTEAPTVVTPPATPRSLPLPLSLSGAKYLATRVLGFAGRELGSVVYSLSACCSMQCRNQPTSRRWRGAHEI